MVQEKTDKKPKVITILNGLWAFLTVVIFLLSIVSLFFLYNISIPEPGMEMARLGMACFGGLLFVFLFGLVFSIFSFKIYLSIRKGNASVIESGILISVLSLLFYSIPFAFLVLMGLGSSFPPPTRWEFLPYPLLFLILITDLLIIVLSIAPSVRVFVKEQKRVTNFSLR